MIKLAMSERKKTFICIVIIGLLEKNSGKTFVAHELGATLQKMTSKKIIPYKPISGSNFWYQADNSKFIIKNKLLLSQDLRITAERLLYQQDIPLTILNPVHSLFFPINIGPLLDGSMKISLMDKYSYDKPILIRYSLWNKKTSLEDRIHVVHKDTPLPEPIQPILESSSKVLYYSSIEDLTELDRKYSPLAIQTTFDYVNEYITNSSDVLGLIIESFNNIVLPKDIIEHATSILLVAPGFVTKMDLEKFLKAYQVVGNNYQQSNKFLELVHPSKLAKLPFNPQEEDLMKIIEELEIEIS